MDVKCERCNTEYEFDDALVSGRGTTVKCTNCGHKFKIRRSDGDFSEDFWNVTTGDGRTLVFTSLRELQRAIQGYLVERNDRLSRGGLPPKAIGQIPELVPFFEQREAAKRSQQSGRTLKTQDGLGPAVSAAPPPPARPRQATKPEFPAPPPDGAVGGQDGANKTTLIGTGPVTDEPAIPVAAAPVVAAAPAVAARPPSAPPPATERQPEPAFASGGSLESPAAKPGSAPPPVPPPRQRDSMNTVPLKRPTPPPPPRVSNPPPLPERARRSSDPGPYEESAAASAPPRRSEPVVASASPVGDLSSPLPPRAHRSLLAEIEDDRDRVRGSSASLPDGPPKRRSVGGFIVATVVAGCALMLGAVWAQKNLGPTLAGKPPAPVATVDPRVATFLATGEKALADGNLELAKESLDKASALSEKDPHVLLGVARLAAVRADVPWLKSRLLPADAADDHRVTSDTLNDLASAARKAADDALLVAPDDPAALRAKIDAFRISGDRDGARALVGKIATSPDKRALDPETAYVLAALDLAEVEPLWSTVIERLKVAASAETGPGRARAALVFALARSGDAAGAKAEVERLVAMTRAYPLLPLLRAFADRASPVAQRDAGPADVSPAVAVPSAPDAGNATAARPGASGGGGGGGGGALPTDARALVSQGERARAKGDYERARTLYTAAIEKNPNDSEALAGLAAIAYAQRDLAGARSSYKRVLAINPNYMPAVVGLADVEWDAGDKATATKMYKDIVDRYPEGAYPARVKQRVEGGG
ncbi:MAG: zinc-ribbon domain-containing protein [Labilithrix sp.]|nr:zinc-ribbon domain-containing protein [Labilithrix sp.]